MSAHASEGSIRTWFVHTDDLVAAARARVSRALTPEERELFAPLLER